MLAVRVGIIIERVWTKMLAVRVGIIIERVWTENKRWINRRCVEGMSRADMLSSLKSEVADRIDVLKSSPKQREELLSAIHGELDKRIQARYAEENMAISSAKSMVLTFLSIVFQQLTQLKKLLKKVLI